MRKKEQQKAFTLIELIVAITILIILSTIWFIWYGSQLPIIRDANRISNLAGISEWLEIYRTKYNLPMAENSIEIQSNGTLVAYQWYVWENILSAIDFTDTWKDPRNDMYYSYYLTVNKTYFQLMWFLEEESSLKTTQIDLFNKTNAVNIDYSERFPTVDWNSLGILTWTWDNLNIPVQELVDGSLDILTTNTEYTAHFLDTDNVTWTWEILSELKTAAEVWWKYCSWDWGVITCADNF